MRERESRVVCVCVCVREREGERDISQIYFRSSQMVPALLQIMPAYIYVSVAMWKVLPGHVLGVLRWLTHPRHGV